MLSTNELSARFAKMGTSHKNGTTLPPGTPLLESEEVRVSVFVHVVRVWGQASWVHVRF